MKVVAAPIPPIQIHVLEDQLSELDSQMAIPNSLALCRPLGRRPGRGAGFTTPDPCLVQRN